MDTDFDIVNISWDELWDRFNLEREYGHVARSNPSANLPYHNAFHHIGVAKTAYLLLQETVRAGGTAQVEDLELYTAVLIWAALLHDFKHTGLPDSLGQNIHLAVSNAALAGFERCYESIEQRTAFVNEIGKLIGTTYYGPDGHQDIDPKTFEPGLFGYTPFCVLAAILGDADIYGNLLPENMFQVMEGLPRELFRPHDEKSLPSPHDWLANNGKFLRSYRPRSAAGAAFADARLENALAAMERYVTEPEYSAQYRLERLEGELHKAQRHPDFEYTETESARKGDSVPPEGLGWKQNPYRNFLREEYTDTEYWYRYKHEKRLEVLTLDQVYKNRAYGVSLSSLVDWLQLLFSDKVIAGGHGAINDIRLRRGVMTADELFGVRDEIFNGLVYYTGEDVEKKESDPFELRTYTHGLGLLSLRMFDVDILINLNAPTQQAWYRVRRNDGLQYIQPWLKWSFGNLPIACEGVTRSLIQ